MTRFVFYQLVTLLISGSALSVYGQGEQSTARHLVSAQQGEVSARAADIPPPPLRVGRIKNSHVKYAANSQVRKYPVPSLVFRREGLGSPEDRGEIIEKIVYPSINKSDKPIAAIVIEFFRDMPEIGVTIIWHAAGSFGTSQYSSALISRNKSGHFSIDAFLRLFPDENN